jgi:hypothetical protein
VTTNQSVSLGGVTVGAAILIVYGIYWWHREKHKPIELVPFALSTAYGMLLILSGGGLLGWAAGTALWGANGIGDHSLIWGVGGTTMDVTRARQIVLQPGGHVVVLLLTVTLAALWKFAKKLRSWKIAIGVLCGICLALSGTVAGAAAVPLGSSANAAGAVFTKAMAR